MKLNYKPQIKQIKNDTHSELRNETKLSMQSLVSQALASKMPSAPPGGVGAAVSASNTGWGKSN